MTEPSYMKCAFCEWRTPRWVTLKNGKRKPGWKRLETHVINAHEHEAQMARYRALIATDETGEHHE